MSSLVKFVFLVLVVILSFEGRAGGGLTDYGLTGTCKSLECPSYDVIYSQGEFEIRRYKKSTWMSTKPIETSSYTLASNIGFNLLFTYIQGNNNEGKMMEMTAPVLVDVGPSSVVVLFYVPNEYQSSPPTSDQVSPQAWPTSKYVAVRRFGGFMNDINIAIEASYLRNVLKGTQWESTTLGSQNHYMVAGYNSPFDEYNDRVNEVMFQIN